tara:strand:+ start:1591 stop:2556 length:966 start_codon:yes stop_codon:yes gene_type:complete
MKKKIKIDTIFQDTFTKVRFYSSAISGIKKDSFASEELASNKNAVASLVGVNKKIFGRDINKEFRKIQNEFRKKYLYKYTHAWQDGEGMASEWRIVSNEKLDTLLNGYEEYEAKFSELVNEIKTDYLRLIQEGMAKLGKLANEQDYKEWHQIEKKFAFNITTDFFSSYDTSNDERIHADAKRRKAIENNVASRYESNFKVLAEKMKKDLEGSITNIINALKKDGSGKSFFKDSVFQGLKDQIETNRDLNKKLFQSEEIDKAIQVCVESLASVNDIDSLRDKGDIGKTKRAKVTQDMEKAKSILNQNTLGKIFSGAGLEEGK